MVKKWYNGYNYLGEPVYNPYDILLFLSNGNEFGNYWWETGNPSFLIQMLKKEFRFIPALENIVVSRETLSTFDVDHIDLVALLWQTGNLTFDKKIELMHNVSYQLKVPNLEIQHSLNALFFDYLTGINGQSSNHYIQTVKALVNQEIDAFIQSLKKLFASIPYENYVKNTIASYEGYYASVTYAFLCNLGFRVVAEDTTNTGRIDMTLIGKDVIYILEFKVDMPSEAALQQIKSEKYYEKYTESKKSMYLIGIHFDSKERNIRDFASEFLSVKS